MIAETVHRAQRVETNIFEVSYIIKKRVNDLSECMMIDKESYVILRN